MPDLEPSDPKFLKAYLAASGEKAPREYHATGTIAAAMKAYEASDHFLSLAPLTREQWRRILTKMRRDVKSAMLADLRARHIRKDLMRLEAHAANSRRKVWRALGRWWLDAGLVDDDPAFAVRARATPPTQGRIPWTEADVTTFRAHWPHSSRERLAFEVLYRTCASIGDACRIGPGMIKDGWLTYTRSKSKSVAVIPMQDAPDWFGMDTHLEQCLAHQPRHMTYITTSAGAPRSHKGAAQWFSRAATAAGLDKEKTAHGVRKYRAAFFKERGATPEQRMAILGHETEAEASRYSKSADLKKVITGTDSSNFSKPVPTYAEKHN